MGIKRGQAIPIVYAAVIIGAIIYFGFLQQFGYRGLVFQVEGRDQVLSPLDVLIVFAAIASLFLFVISLMAYRRNRDLRVLVVSMAFFFFVVKEILFLFENFFPGEHIYIDNAERTLELLILLSFIMLMYGVSRRYEKGARKKEEIK
jgi:hypothetical protein